jgi:ubiquitin-like domain-containing CTD phosphatase 1
MNKQQGLVIRPYKRAALNRSKDLELLNLAHYLTLVGALESLSHLDHRRWERYLARNWAGAAPGGLPPPCISRD